MLPPFPSKASRDARAVCVQFTEQLAAEADSKHELIAPLGLRVKHEQPRGLGLVGLSFVERGQHRATLDVDGFNRQLPLE